MCYNDIMAKVSLIIPVYNKSQFLNRCLNSIANQTEKDAQIILIDDGSTDDSKGICKEYAKKYGWEFYKIKHQGVSEARNFGLDKATCEYVAFLDADGALTDDALDIMTRISRHGYNIYQFGQIRYRGDENSLNTCYCAIKGHYTLDNIPKYWVMVWNKLYKRSFLNRHKIRFDKTLTFGEDEIFNARCVLANGGLYHAPQTLVKHFLDDKKSICRGGMCHDYLAGLDNALRALAKKQKDPRKALWIECVRQKHLKSKLFINYEVKEEIPHKPTGHYDIVYFLKNSPTNEELMYSLRSVEQNFQYHEVWFYGGCPNNLRPDHHIATRQLALSKWQRVRDMLYQACQNDDITENFWLFNDDFFILKPKKETMPVQYNRTLEERIKKIEGRHDNKPNEYTRRLRHLVETLKKAGKPTKDYAVHKPMLINRKKMIEVLDKFPDEPMSRALYGNYYELGGVSKHDMKIQLLRYNKMSEVMQQWDFLSTSDESFENGTVGRYIKNKFIIKSRFEL